MDEKNELLDELEQTDRGIDRLILPAVFILIFGYFVFLPKIYISNSIYISSLELERQKVALKVLQDQNQNLRREVEIKAFELEYSID